MAAEHLAAGAAVEAAAAQWLQRQGLTPLARNVRYRDGELDLVMRDGDVLVFVEVRYRADAAFGGAAASIGAAKQRRLIRAAQRFLASEPALARLPARFDVIAAEGDPAAPRLQWLRDAFRLEG
ncbi:YraN family protein [Luteimonas sp. e5]